MILLDSSDSLQVLLAGAVATTQPVLYAAYADHGAGTFTPDSSSGAANGATAVDWIAAPAANIKRQAKYLSLYNADTAAVVATVCVVDNATNRILLKVTLGVGERLEYVDGEGFRVLAADGSEKMGSLSASRIPNTQTVTSAATVTPTFDNDAVVVTAQAAALSLANPMGTAIPCLGMVIRIKDNGTARAISYGTQYRAIGITLPTTTVIGKTTYIAMIYNATDTKWDCLATGTEA